MVEGVLRPVDVARLTVDERYMWTRSLEVVEVLRVDVGELIRIPNLGEVSTRQ